MVMPHLSEVSTAEAMQVKQYQELLRDLGSYLILVRMQLSYFFSLESRDPVPNHRAQESIGPVLTPFHPYKTVIAQESKFLSVRIVSGTLRRNPAPSTAVLALSNFHRYRSLLHRTLTFSSEVKFLNLCNNGMKKITSSRT